MQPPLTRRGFGRLSAAALAIPALINLALITPTRAQSRLTIAAVNYPLAYFAERLAGDLADVVFPVPAGTDPSFWRPSVGDIAMFQSADLILLNGAGFADWTARTTLPRSRILRTSTAFEEAFIATETVTHSHGEGGEHSHTGTASYVWLDFAQAEAQALSIAAALTRIAPDAEAEIAANLATLTADLGALDAAAGGLVADGPVITSHPRYQYFGRAYGLTLDAVDWDAATPPTERQWQDLAARAAETGARVFIWEADPGPEARARMDALGLANAVFPPLANRPATGDFLSVMQTSLEALQTALATPSEG